MTMKKQKIVALALGTIIGLGSLFGGAGAHANELNGTCDTNECVMDAGTFGVDELVGNSVLSKAEFKQYNEAIDKIMKLYEDIEGKELSDEVLENLFVQEDKIYEANKAIFDKVDAYYSNLEDAPENMEPNEGDEEMSPEDMEEALYAELVDFEILTPDELVLFKEAEQKLYELYASDDMDFDAISKKEDAIYEKYKAVIDKVDKYYEELEEDEYQGMLDSGEITEKQLEQLKQADEKADKLFNTLDENSTDEDVDRVLEEVDKLYEAIGF